MARYTQGKSSVESDNQQNKSCPIATKDLPENTKNRQFAIQNYLYGPPNPQRPSVWYWKRLAVMVWNVPDNEVTEEQLEDIKSMRCSNCVAFDISDRMEKCMPGPVTYAGKLGYCWMHDFKCASLRACSTWASGGPIDDDDTSYDWQNRQAEKG